MQLLPWRSVILSEAADGEANGWAVEGSRVRFKFHRFGRELSQTHVRRSRGNIQRCPWRCMQARGPSTPQCPHFARRIATLKMTNEEITVSSGGAPTARST